MSTANPIRVLLVEDHPLTGELLHTFLKTFPNVDVIGRAQDGEEAVAQAGMLDPAVIVMDVNLPKMDGIAATREIKTRYPDIVVVGLTFRIEDYIVYAMLKAGAFHVVAKDNLVTDLYRTIQQAVAAAHPIVVLAETTVNPKPTEHSSQFPLRDASDAGKSPA